MKNWIHTVSGKMFELSYDGRFEGGVDPASIHVPDIAHHLSLINRFVGATPGGGYSVAAHSVLVMHLCPDECKLEGLMHDAAEAYIGDVSGPLKIELGMACKRIEQRIERAIAAKYALVYPWPDAVKRADMRALAIEKHQLMTPTNHPEWPCLVGVERDPDGAGWGTMQGSPEAMRAEFLEQFDRLMLTRNSI